MAPRARHLSFDDVVRLAQRLPGVDVATSYGTPALKVNARLIARLWEDGTTLVLRVPFAVRDHLIATAPAAFFLTDHYRNHPWVLARLGATSAEELQPRLTEAWRQAAPKKLIAQVDALG